MFRAVLVSMVTVMLPVCLSLRIGAFNIQVFGTSKAAKPHVMDILVQVSKIDTFAQFQMGLY